MQLHSNDKKICTQASQRNGEYNGAECFVLENNLIVLRGDLQGRSWKYRVSYLNGIKIEDNEGTEYTFEEKKPIKKSAQVSKDDANEATL